MNAEQKRAWMGVGCMAASLAGFASLVPFAGVWPATAAFALFAVNGFAPLIGRGETTDERDRSIARRATLGGAMASYVAFVIGCMSTWFVAFAWQGRDQVPVHLLGTITVLGLVVFYFVRSLAVLVLYGRHAEADGA